VVSPRDEDVEFPKMVIQAVPVPGNRALRLENSSPSRKIQSPEKRITTDPVGEVAPPLAT
jgi:hypothetical protein